MRLAGIDVGTNTVLLVVADVVDGRMYVVKDQERFARLGQGVDAAGRLAPEAMQRAIDRLTECRDVAMGLGAERVIIGATSASRDASNTRELADRVFDELGLDFRVISGEREAALSFRGALAMLSDPAPAEAAVIDVGGGSTEIIAGPAGGTPGERVSLNVGSVRLSERHFRELPARVGAVDAARDEVRAALAGVPAAVAGVRPIVGVAGTARVAATLARGEGAGPAGHFGGPVSTAAVRAWAHRLLSMSVQETLDLDRALMAGRADVAGAGLLILAEALDALGAEAFVYSPGGLRHGLVLEVGVE